MKTAKAKNIAEIMEKSWVLDKQQYDADPGPLLTLISFFFKVNLFPPLGSHNLAQIFRYNEKKSIYLHIFSYLTKM